jgi:hypothetical protein
MIVALAHPPIHDLLAAPTGVSHEGLAASAVAAGPIFLVGLAVIVVILLVAIGQVIDVLSRALTLLGTLVLGLILVIGIGAVGLPRLDIVPTAPPTTAVAPPLPHRPFPRASSRPGPTPSTSRPAKPQPSQSPRSSRLTAGAPTFVAARNRTGR